jgi:hypothetical protein
MLVAPMSRTQAPYAAAFGSAVLARRIEDRSTFHLVTYPGPQVNNQDSLSLD